MQRRICLIVGYGSGDTYANMHLVRARTYHGTNWKPAIVSHGLPSVVDRAHALWVFNRSGMRVQREGTGWKITTVYPGGAAADAGTPRRLAPRDDQRSSRRQAPRAPWPRC